MLLKDDDTREPNFEVIGYTKPSLAMYVLHNLHGQLSQYHDFMVSLSGDREGAWLISVGTKFHN